MLGKRALSTRRDYIRRYTIRNRRVRPHGNLSQSKDIEVKVAKFLWGASGRALTLDRPDGLTKLIIEPETERILGVGIAGARAGDLISEGVLAVEMGATARDLAETVHPHPTLSETLMEAAESFYGTATHTFSRRPS